MISKVKSPLEFPIPTWHIYCYLQTFWKGLCHRRLESSRNWFSSISVRPQLFVWLQECRFELLASSPSLLVIVLSGSNYLSGAVPNELVSLSNLLALDLSGNFELSGSLDGLCNSTMMILQNDAEATIEKPSFFASEPLICSCCSKLENWWFIHNL